MKKAPRLVQKMNYFSCAPGKGKDQVQRKLKKEGLSTTYDRKTI